MNQRILSYNQINEQIEEDLSFEEVERLFELGLIDNSDLIKIYDYVKNGSIGKLDLTYSRLQHLPNWLTKVNGALDISRSNIEDIPDALEITNSIYANYSKLKEFRRTEVHIPLSLDYSKITKLPNNLIVHAYLSVEGIQFEQFPKDLVIEGAFYIAKSNLLQFSDEELREMYKIKYEINRGI